MQRLERMWSVVGLEPLGTVGAKGALGDFSPAALRERAMTQLVEDRRIRTEAQERSEAPPPPIGTPMKILLNKQMRAAERVKGIYDDIVAATERDADGKIMRITDPAKLVERAVAEAKAQKDAGNTSGDAMSLVSMYRYTAMSAGMAMAGRPLLAAATAFHGLVSNSGWLRAAPMGGKMNLYFPGMRFIGMPEGLRTNVSSLYEGNGVLWIGKRIGRKYNSMLESPKLHGNKTVYDADHKRMTDPQYDNAGGLIGKVADTLHLTPGPHAAAMRKMNRTIVTGLAVPVLAYASKQFGVGPDEEAKKLKDMLQDYYDKHWGTDDRGPDVQPSVSPSTSPTTTPGSTSPSSTATPTTTTTASPGASATTQASAQPTTAPTTAPGTDEPGPGRKTPPPKQPVAEFFIVDDTISGGTFFGISSKAVKAGYLLTQLELDTARAGKGGSPGGYQGVRYAAIDRLYELNPRFEPALADGDLTSSRHDPDLLITGDKINVGPKLRDVG
jgi:hypothetical protein